MRQITQKDLVKLIEEKQENAKNAYEAIIRKISCSIEEGQDILAKERNKAYIDCYQDLICYTNSVEIVPEKKPLDNVLQETVPIMPRFREFIDDDVKYFLDAKKIEQIKKDDNLIIIFTPTENIWLSGDEAYYQEICDWWKYWTKGE